MGDNGMIILATIVNAAMLEVSFVAALSRRKLSYSCKLFCTIIRSHKIHGLNNLGIRISYFCILSVFVHIQYRLPQAWRRVMTTSQ